MWDVFRLEEAGNRLHRNTDAHLANCSPSNPKRQMLIQSRYPNVFWILSCFQKEQVKQVNVKVKLSFTYQLFNYQGKRHHCSLNKRLPEGPSHSGIYFQEKILFPCQKSSRDSLVDPSRLNCADSLPCLLSAKIRRAVKSWPNIRDFIACN